MAEGDKEYSVRWKYYHNRDTKRIAPDKATLRRNFYPKGDPRRADP